MPDLPGPNAMSDALKHQPVGAGDGQTRVINTADLSTRIEELEEALFRIAQWSEAYPTDIFHEPDAAELQRAHEVLKANGMGIIAERGGCEIAG